MTLSGPFTASFPLRFARFFVLVLVLDDDERAAIGGSTLGPGGTGLPQILPRSPQIFGHSSSATGWINWFYSKFRLAVVASQIMRGQAPQIFFPRTDTGVGWRFRYILYIGGWDWILRYNTRQLQVIRACFIHFICALQNFYSILVRPTVCR